jgi:hypothetical protein
MACNPVATYNQYTSNGSTTTYNFTFPYLKTSDVQVQVISDDPASENDVITDLTVTTHYSVSSSNPTQIVLTSAGLTIAANGSTIRIYRCTTNQFLTAEFQAGSAIRATDLNINFDQVLYTTQESNVRSTDANTTSRTAVTTAETLGNQAIATANVAVTTANQAVTTANSAVTTANGAVATANSAAAAIANAVIYDPIPNVASIPSPSGVTYIEIADSTGIESFSPLTGLPSGFIGDSGLTVRIKYVSNTWSWQMYFANDVNDRFIKKTGDTFTGLVTLSGAPTANLHAATKQYVDSSVTNNSDLVGGGTDRIFVEHDQTVTTSYSLTANKNALAVGPLAFNSSVTVTVPSTSNLVII